MQRQHCHTTLFRLSHSGSLIKWRNTTKNIHVGSTDSWLGAYELLDGAVGNISLFSFTLDTLCNVTFLGSRMDGFGKIDCKRCDRIEESGVGSFSASIIEQLFYL